MSYSSKTNNTKKKSNKMMVEKIDISINVHMIDNLLAYTLSANELVNKKALINLRELVTAIDMEMYEQDYPRRTRLLLLNKILEGQLEQKINQSQLLYEFCMAELSAFSVDVMNYYQEAEQMELSNDEVAYVSSFVEDYLTHIHLFRHAGSLEAALQQLRLNQGTNLRLLNQNFEEVIDGLYVDMKSAKANNGFSAQDFNINSDSARNVMSQTIHELNKPNNKLKTGLKQLNKMLDGGFENGRTYLIFGLPKGFKSGTLLNICIWTCKYNKDIETKDKNKKPCVLYVTQENSVRETMERIFVYSTGKSVKEYDEDEAMRIIRDEIIGDSPVDLFVKYRPNKSISTVDLNAMCDDLETEGYEVIMLVQDYTKRIRPSYVTGDLRIDLGTVVDEFTVIAKTRNIPLVSAGQLNREAYRILESALQRGKTDIGKDLSASHIGESALMLENTDYGIIINKEDVGEQGEFLTAKLIASRSKKPKVTYFVHPFENGLRLQEDVLLAKSLSQEKISGDNFAKDFNPNTARESAKNNQMFAPKPPTPVANPMFGGNNTSEHNKHINSLNPNNNINLPAEVGNGLEGME